MFYSQILCTQVFVLAKIYFKGVLLELYMDQGLPLL